MVIPQARWMVFFMGNPIRMDDLGVPPFQEMPIYIIFTHTHTGKHMVFQENGRFSMTVSLLSTPIPRDYRDFIP